MIRGVARWFKPPTPVEVEEELYARDQVLADIVAKLLAGDLRVRAFGVSLLLVGLALATAGNVWGLA